jgi:hypothetical protein
LFKNWFLLVCGFIPQPGPGNQFTGMRQVVLTRLLLVSLILGSEGLKVRFLFAGVEFWYSWYIPKSALIHKKMTFNDFSVGSSYLFTQVGY